MPSVPAVKRVSKNLLTIKKWLRCVKFGKAEAAIHGENDQRLSFAGQLRLKPERTGWLLIG